ncbi:MAG: TRAP transporter substrate-binding protein [Rhodospirillum sp.]|nr:TRAP transporter substrate-binding protein [Rhodospirillum sp.]MCF8487921.1 TRAP transporter substrate-binding protein [Rhodospirillum sp.]MCF8500678.1 TRAP transporter substrate-binding protein [Rhodospirillum sp.]
MLRTIRRAALVGATALGMLSTAQAAEVTLRFGSIWPEVANVHKSLIEAWAKSVESDSKGRIHVELYPSATLAKPAVQYEAVSNRVMDVTATVLGYTANRFPLTQVVEVPGISKNAVHGSCVVQGLYDEGLLNSEFEDTHPLFFFTHGPGLLHTRDKVVKEPKDLEGLRIRRPSTVVAQLLERYGAQPVGMPAPEAYPSLQRGVIDGVAFPWQGALAFRLNELATAHTELGGLYTVVFLVTMNKGAYDDMPDDLKAVIDKNSGTPWATVAGQVFDADDVVGRNQAVEAGHTIYVVDGGIENPAWKPALMEAADAYVQEVEDKGLPGKAVHTRALELAKTCPTQ